MDLEGYIACICEGSAEQVVIEILLESDKLIFDNNKLLDGEVIRVRSAASFEQKYLGKDFKEKITILRILDSRKENFKLGRAYISKIKVINVITAPEIEVLVIINEGKYQDYKSSKQKPSEYCKRELGLKDIKSAQGVKKYFSNPDVLVDCIKKYKQQARLVKGEITLFDLLK
ncbi:MAG: hypothetical protein ACRCZJ_02050 [Erysipelotrichaceae bacterium]